MNKKKVMVGLILFASIFPQSEIFSLTESYILVAISYSIVFLYLLKYDYKIQAPRWTTYFLFPMFLMYIIILLIQGFLSEANPGTIIRIPAYTIPLIFNFWIIPTLVTKKEFFSIISLISTIVVVIGIPTLYSDYTILGSQVTSRGTISIFGAELPRLVSIFSNPNAAGFLFSIGFISSVIFYFAYEKKLYLFIVLINFIGLYMAKSRAAYLGVFIAVVAVVFHQRLTVVKTRISVLCGCSGVVILLAMISGLVPEFSIINQVNLSGRSDVWEAAIPLILDRPLFGYGPVPMAPLLDAPNTGGIHNGYLRQFLHIGVIGGLLYCLFVIAIIIDSVPEKKSVEEFLVFASVLAISVNELFNGNTIFGISNGSVLTSIIYGYAVLPSE